MVYMAIKYLISIAIYVQMNVICEYFDWNVCLDTYVCINERERYFRFLIKEYHINWYGW